MRPREGEKAANRGRKEGVKREDKGWKTAAYLSDKAVNLSDFVEIRRRSSTPFAARAEPLRTPERGLLRPGNSPAAPEGEGVKASRRRPPLGERSRPPFPTRTPSKADGSRTAPTKGRPRGTSPPSAGSEGRKARMRPMKGSAAGFRGRERRLGQEVDRRADDEQDDGGDLHAAGVPPEMLALSVLNHLLRPSERRGTPRC